MEIDGFWFVGWGWVGGVDGGGFVWLWCVGFGLFWVVLFFVLEFNFCRCFVFGIREEDWVVVGLVCGV